MANLTKLRPYTLAPHPSDEANVKLFFDWIQTSLNALIGQQVPPTTGLGAMTPPTVNPSSSQLVSAGARVGALATNFSASAPSTTSIQIFWDGSNSSTVLRLYRDDGTVAGPFPGSQLVSGLTANTKYFFYPYFDEASQRVLFVSVAGAVGTPPIAYTTASIAVAQQQILRGRIPLASNLATTGFSTPAAGNTPAANQGGGGGGVGAHLGTGLTQ